MNNQKVSPQTTTPSFPLWSYQLQRDSKLAVRTRKDLEVQLITRALKDEEFKQELLANPKAVVEKELGTKLPEELEINVLEETETTLYMVLPNNPYEGLAESELKASLGLTYEEVAQWVLERQRNTLLDEAGSVTMVSQAWKDEAFKQELLCNPRAVIDKEWETEIQEGINIRMFEETAYILYIVLPQLGDVDTTEEAENLIRNQGYFTANNGEGRLLFIASSHIIWDHSKCGGSCPPCSTNN